MVIGVLCRVIFHSCRLRVYVTEHESPVVSSASETTLPYTLRSSLERTTIIAMSDIAQHILSLLTLSVPGESAASPSQAPPSDDDSDPQVPASATDTFPSPSPSFNSYLGLARLRARASHLLTVFDDPRFAPLDVPDWARRCHARITVRGLVQAMCAAAQELGLADGERYVLDAVCACEPAAQEERGRTDHSRTHSATVTEGGAEAGGEADALARRLQHLASAWVAFLLWPCTSSSLPSSPPAHPCLTRTRLVYARMKDPESWARGYASPCTGLSHAPKAMAYGTFDPDECIPSSSYTLRDQVRTSASSGVSLALNCGRGYGCGRGWGSYGDGVGTRRSSRAMDSGAS